MRRLAFGLLMAVAGCGGKAESEGGEDNGSESGDSGDSGDASALPDIDLDQWCGEIDSPPLAAIDTSHRPNSVIQIGPCGHVVSTSHIDGADQVWLTKPDGTRQPLVSNAAEFDATGQLLFLYGSGFVELHDLGTGTVYSAEDTWFQHGFVRSADPQHPTVPWTCSSSGELVMIRGEQATELITGFTDCYNAVGSLGNSKLLVVRDRQIYVVDVDSGEQRATAIDDFYGPGSADDGVPRSDELRINYTGSLAVHEVVVGQYLEHEIEYEAVERRILDIARGEVVETCDHNAFLYQAPTQHAPAFVLCGDRLLVWHDGELVQLNEAPIVGLKISNSGTSIFGDQVGQGYEIFRVSAENPTQVDSIASIAMVEYGFPQISASGEAIAYDEAAELYQWTANAGLGPPVPLAGDAEVLLVLDDASVFTWVNPSQLLFIDAAAQVVGQWDFGAEAFDGFQQLADGRAVVSTRDPISSLLSIWLIDIEAPTDEPTLVLGPVDAIEPKFDGQRRRMAIDVGTTLWWGQI